jgi:hypothetical protein
LDLGGTGPTKKESCQRAGRADGSASTANGVAASPLRVRISDDSGPTPGIPPRRVRSDDHGPPSARPARRTVRRHRPARVDAPRQLPWRRPDVFDPGRGGNIAAALAICQGCPVRAECLEYALTTASGWEFGGRPANGQDAKCANGAGKRPPEPHDVMSGGSGRILPRDPATRPVWMLRYVWPTVADWPTPSGERPTANQWFSFTACPGRGCSAPTSRPRLPPRCDW